VTPWGEFWIAVSVSISVCFSGFGSMSNGKMKSDHAPMKEVRPTTVNVPRTWGRKMDQKRRSSPAPSIRAASSISSGMPMNAARIMRIWKGPIIATIHTPGSVL